MRRWKLISQPGHIFAHMGPEFAEAELWVVEEFPHPELTRCDVCRKPTMLPGPVCHDCRERARMRLLPPANA